MKLHHLLMLAFSACTLFSTPAHAAINPNKLGASYDATKANVAFKVYSSRATRIELYLYSTATGSAEKARYVMTAGAGGVWSTTIPVTTLNSQGNDYGTSYRSAIFPTSMQQEQIARETIADVDASGLWPGKPVTTIEPAGSFWEAEPEHQDYLITYPNGYTCHFERPDWVLPSRTEADAPA